MSSVGLVCGTKKLVTEDTKLDIKSQKSACSITLTHGVHSVGVESASFSSLIVALTYFENVLGS